MAKLLKLRRGSTSSHASFTGAEGEVTIDTTKDTAVIHDGAQAGGRPLAREDMSNVSSASIAGQLGTDSIATTKIAAGALPTDVTVASANIVDGTIVSADIADGTIVNADVNASAAIAGTKVAPNFGSQNIVTTGSSTLNGTVTINADGTTPALHLQGSGPQIIRLADESSESSGLDLVFRTSPNTFNIETTDNSTSKFAVNYNGQVTITDNLDVGAGVDVTGNMAATGNVTGDNMTASGDITANGGDIRIYGTQPGLHLTDTDNNDDFLIYNNNGVLKFYDATDGADRMWINSAGQVNVNGNLSIGGTVDGRDVAADGTKLDTYEANGSSYVRSDASDTLSGSTYTFNASAGEKIVLEGATDPYIRFKEGSTNKAYIQWNSSGYLFLYNQESGESLKIGSGSNGLVYTDGGSEKTVWHSGNHGAGSGLDADAVDGIAGSSLLRSDANDTASGTITFSGGSGAITISGNSDIRLSNGGWSGDTTKLQHHDNYLYIVGGSQGHILRDTSGHNNLIINANGDGTFVGNVTAYSDQRLKTDIHTINDALGICGKLRGVSYKWIRDGKPSIGVIAQEVAEVLPEIVLTNHDLDPSTGESIEVKSVDYGKIVGVLINAINELKAEVDELKGGK